VTLTLPVINSARNVFFLVTGRQKAAIVGRILASAESSEDLPATLVRPDPGMSRWMLDAEAASRLPFKPDTAC
jgi:6-phosphogluconolactonase